MASMLMPGGIGASELFVYTLEGLFSFFFDSLFSLFLLNYMGHLEMVTLFCFYLQATGVCSESC